MKTLHPENCKESICQSVMPGSEKGYRLRVEGVPRTIDLLKTSSPYRLRLERQQVQASEVFHNERSWKALQHYRKGITLHEARGKIPPSVAAINKKMTVKDGYIPEGLSHQDLPGRELLRQAKYIHNTSFFHAVGSHHDYTELPGFEIPKRLLVETLTTLNALREIGNLFRKNPIKTMIGSNAEVKIARRCYGSLWPAGINLYEILRELYPAFHARITGQVPAYIGSHMDDLLDGEIDRHEVRGIGRFGINEQGRFLGLYPVANVPADQVTEDSPFVAQDQLGRKFLIKNILRDIIEVLQTNSKHHVLVIDYAGGVGNMSELLIEKIYGLPDAELKRHILERVRIAVIDIADDQLEAGKNRFNHLVLSRHKRITEKIIFLKGDVTKPLTTGHRNAMKMKFGKTFMKSTLCLGMTSYTIGALDNFTMSDGTSVANAMADEMFKQCWKVYAVDFSSPMWRFQGFLKDTGRWGREYLRVVHGHADEEDEMLSLNRAVSWYLKMRFGLSIRSVADFVRLMAIGPALAAHYTTVWPYRDGHNAGYCVLEDGTVKKPGILSFAERLEGCGAPVQYRSKVWLVGTVDLGKTSRSNRAWAFIPGWMADFVIAENVQNRCQCR